MKNYPGTVLEKTKMTYHKYCDICDTFVTCTFKPNWCPWCGKDLREETLVDFVGIDGRLDLLNEIRGFPDPPDKIPWDGYYSYKSGRHSLLKKGFKEVPKIVEVRQISLF